MPSDHQPDIPWLQRGHVPGLDGLRGVAILFVIVGHSVAFQTNNPSHVWTRLAEWGVDLFFAISGFIITLLLMREMQQTKTVDLRHFYYRRALRILPPYLAFLAFVFLGEWLAGPYLFGYERVGLVTFTLNNMPMESHEVGHIWSLSLEEQFYLLWPGILWWLGPRRGLVCASVIILVVPFARYFIRHYVALTYVPFCTPTRLDGIMTGCIVAILATGVAGPRLRTFRSLGNAFVVLVIALFYLYRHACEQFSFSYIFYHTGSALFMAFIVWIVITSNGWVARFFQQRWLTTIGLLSYSLYLWQQPFLYRDEDKWWTHFPANLFIVFGIAATSYWCLEKPLLRWRDRLRRKETIAATPEGGPSCNSPVAVVSSDACKSAS